jgi:hypothetical protein
MKAKHEFRFKEDYYKYLHTHFMANAMHAVITQNLMYAETDEVEQKNKPEEVYKKAKVYADFFTNNIKNDNESKTNSKAN